VCVCVCVCVCVWYFFPAAKGIFLCTGCEKLGFRSVLVCVLRLGSDVTALLLLLLLCVQNTSRQTRDVTMLVV